MAIKDLFPSLWEKEKKEIEEAKAKIQVLEKVLAIYQATLFPVGKTINLRDISSVEVLEAIHHGQIDVNQIYQVLAIQVKRLQEEAISTEFITDALSKVRKEKKLLPRNYKDLKRTFDRIQKFTKRMKGKRLEIIERELDQNYYNNDRFSYCKRQFIRIKEALDTLVEREASFLSELEKLIASIETQVLSQGISSVNEVDKVRQNILENSNRILDKKKYLKHASVEKMQADAKEIQGLDQKLRLAVQEFRNWRETINALIQQAAPRIEAVRITLDEDLAQRRKIHEDLYSLVHNMNRNRGERKRKFEIRFSNRLKKLKNYYSQYKDNPLHEVEEAISFLRLSASPTERWKQVTFNIPKRSEGTAKESLIKKIINKLDKDLPYGLKEIQDIIKEMIRGPPLLSWNDREPKFRVGPESLQILLRKIDVLTELQKKEPFAEKFNVISTKLDKSLSSLSTRYNASSSFSYNYHMEENLKKIPKEEIDDAYAQSIKELIILLIEIRNKLIPIEVFFEKDFNEVLEIAIDIDFNRTKPKSKQINLFR